MRLGYNTWSMPTLGFGDAVRHCASLGFDSVEVTVSEGWTTDVMKIARNEPAEWKRVVADAGLVITSLTANAPIIAEGDIWRKSRERLVRSLELAAELQAPGQRMPISLGAQRPEIEYSGLPPSPRKSAGGTSAQSSSKGSANSRRSQPRRKRAWRSSRISPRSSARRAARWR